MAACITTLKTVPPVLRCFVGFDSISSLNMPTWPGLWVSVAQRNCRAVVMLPGEDYNRNVANIKNS